mgnify:CR=1 FL=1
MSAAAGAGDAQYRKMTQTPIPRLVATLAVPTIISMLVTAVYNMADTFFVAQLGTSAAGAVGIVFSLMAVIQAIGFMLGMGAGNLVSRYLGAKEQRQADCAASTAFFTALAFGLGITVLGTLFLDPLMRVLGATPTILPYARDYARYILFGAPVMCASFVLNNILRGEGKAMLAMVGIGLGGVLNIGLDPLFIYTFRLGIAGAAIATLLSRVAEFLICLVCALRSRILPLDLAAFFRPGWEMLRRFVKYSTPVILNETAWGLGNSLLTVILGYTDNSVEMLAANAVMGNLNRLFLVVCFGLGAATAVMIGKAIGEGRSHREVMDLSRTLLVFTLLVGTGLAAVSLALVPTVFVPVVFPLFKLYGESAAIATALAVTGFLSIPLHAYSISAVTGVLRAGGDVFWSTLLDVGPQWCMALPLTALLALVLKADYWWIAAAIQSESLLKVPLCALRIRTGQWIHDVTVRKERGQ